MTFPEVLNLNYLVEDSTEESTAKEESPTVLQTDGPEKDQCIDDGELSPFLHGDLTMSHLPSQIRFEISEFGRILLLLR